MLNTLSHPMSCREWMFARVVPWNSIASIREDQKDMPQRVNRWIHSAHMQGRSVRTTSFVVSNTALLAKKNREDDLGPAISMIRASTSLGRSANDSRGVENFRIRSITSLGRT